MGIAAEPGDNGSGGAQGALQHEVSQARVKLPAALRQLQPLPQALGRALQLTRDPGSRRSDLAQVLSLDQAMTGTFLRMVNSAHYGLPRRVASLEEAIAFLGYETVEKTVISLSARSSLTKPLPAYMLGPHMLWKHSVAVAQGSEWIAVRRGLCPGPEAYVAGLFHDVGKVVLDLVLCGEPEWADAAGGDAEPAEWTEVETRLLGFHHAEISAAVVENWNLPEHVVESVARHHSPAGAEHAPGLTAAVHVANVAALMAGIGLGVDGLRYGLEPEAINALAWTEEEMMDLIGLMPGAVEEAERLLGFRR